MKPNRIAGTLPTLAWALCSSHAAFSLDLAVEIRHQADKAAQPVRMVSLRVGTVARDCQARSQASSFLCQGFLNLGVEDEVVLDIEPADTARVLRRTISLDFGEWRDRERATLTVFLASPVTSVSHATIRPAREYLEAADPQPDRALALLEAINERVFAQASSIGTQNRGLILYNYGRALQNLCLWRNYRYATCEAAVSALRGAEELQRQNPGLLSVDQARYSPDLVRRAISDIATDRSQREAAKRHKAYEDARSVFGEGDYCGAGARYSKLVESYEHAADEARYLRDSGAFYFLLSYEEGVSLLNCGEERIRQGRVAEGCVSLRRSTELLSEVLPREKSETIPAGQEVLWRAHRARIEFDLPSTLNAVGQSRRNSCGEG